MSTKTRMPIVKTEADVDRLSDLSPEEKVLAKENLKKVPLTDGWALMGSDPEAQAFFSMVENGIQKLLRPDVQADPGGPMSLSGLYIAKRMNGEWMSSLLNVLYATSIEPWEKKDFSAAHLGLIDFPDSPMWSAEQSLTLRFTQACYDGEMSDELYNEAREMWGDKRILRLTLWFGFVQTWVFIQNTAGLSYVPGSHPELESGISNPRLVENSLWPKAEKTWEGLMSVWSGISIPKP